MVYYRNAQKHAHWKLKPASLNVLWNFFYCMIWLSIITAHLLKYVRYPTCEPQMQSSNPPGDFVDIYWIKFKSYFPPKIAYFLPNWLVRVHQRLVDHVICHNRVVFCRFEQLLYGILMSHLKLSCISFLFICFDVGQLYLLHNTTQTHQA